MMDRLAAEHAEEKTVMIHATYLMAHRTATCLAAKIGARGRLAGWTKGGKNTKLHAIRDSQGRPFGLFVTAGPLLGDVCIACQATGQDYIGAQAQLSSLPKFEWLLEDRDQEAI